MDKERKEIFDRLEQLKIKAGETLKASYFKPGGTEPLFVITDRVDGTFTLYSVDGTTLKKMQSASSVKTLEAVILPQLS